ncbi:MAG: response regulator transcription factor [Oscillospiraceae bacterium]
MGHTIYLADDEKSIRELLHSFLASDGYAVRSFESGDALLEAFRQEPAGGDLDIMMPGTDGLAGHFALFPIFPSSAHGQGQRSWTMSWASARGDDYLTNPFAQRYC